ncbi:putative LRR receptor-like serine/threonine-protein kinase [Hordeum vulgare]|nr:putative LRR receptor-like serine/threonine-protein kinase [Hordeum vulgare]
MTEAEAEFAVAHLVEMAGQQAILDSIRDEDEVEANHRLIRQRQAEADALFDELDAEVEAEEAAAEQLEAPERAMLWQPTIYPLKGTKIVDISNEE